MSSTFSAIDVKISQEYSAYKREAKVEETARFIFEAATSSIALVIFFVLLTLFILLLISFVPAIIIFETMLYNPQLPSSIAPRLFRSTFLTR